MYVSLKFVKRDFVSKFALEKNRKEVDFTTQ